MATYILSMRNPMAQHLYLNNFRILVRRTSISKSTFLRLILFCYKLKSIFLCVLNTLSSFLKRDIQAILNINVHVKNSHKCLTKSSKYHNIKFTATIEKFIVFVYVITKPAKIVWNWWSRNFVNRLIDN